MPRFKTIQPLTSVHERAGNTRLRGLLSHAERIARWDEAIQPRLPDRLRHQIRLLNLRHGTAVFGCRDGLGHHLIRWHERSLIKLLQTVCDQEVNRVKAQVWRDPIIDTPTPARTERRISPRAADHLQQLADNEQEPGWRALFQRLAKRV